MKIYKLNRLTLILGVLILGFISNSEAQIVREKFEKLLISENFDSAGTVWQTMATGENLFLVQNGEYILQRKSDSSPFAIIGAYEKSFTDFRLLTSIKLDKAYAENATVGLLIMAQPGGNGGFVLELNDQKQFRLRQIADGVYQYVTGTSKDGGWVKIVPTSDPGGFNLIEVISSNHKYDLYINKSFMISFADPGYTSGKMGYIIGPSSRGKVDFLYMFEKSILTGSEMEGAIGGATDPNVVELAESIILLRNQVNQLNDENESLKKTISAMKSGDQEQEVNMKNYEKQIVNLNSELKTKDHSIDSLKKANQELKKYKDIVGDNVNSDIVISLSKNLKAEREKREALEDENAELREKLGLPPTTTKVRTKPKTTSPDNSSFDLPEK